MVAFKVVKISLAEINSKLLSKSIKNQKELHLYSQHPKLDLKLVQNMKPNQR